MRIKPKHPAQEAIQFTGSNGHEVQDFAGAAYVATTRIMRNGNELQVSDLDRPGDYFTLNQNDWLVKDGLGNCFPFESGLFEQEYETGDPPSPEKPDYPQTLAALLEWMREYGNERQDIAVKIWHDGGFKVLADWDNSLLHQGKNILTDLPTIKSDPVKSFLNAMPNGWIHKDLRPHLSGFFQYLKENDLLK